MIILGSVYFHQVKLIEEWILIIIIIMYSFRREQIK